MIREQQKEIFHKKLEDRAIKITRFIGSTQSLILHTIMFAFFVVLIIFGVSFDKVMLLLTTIVSLEAIYLSIFIQMSVNRHSAQLESVSEDIEEIQEDVEEIQKDVELIEEDIDEIQEDVELIEKDIDEIQEDVDEIQEDVEGIEEDIEAKPAANKTDSKIVIEKDVIELIKNMNQKISDLQSEIKVLTKTLPAKKPESTIQKVTKLLKK